MSRILGLGYQAHPLAVWTIRTVQSHARGVRFEVLVRRWLLGAAILFAAFVWWIPGPVDPTGRHLGGDFLNFYTAGYMVLSGRGSALYDLAAQMSAQAELIAPLNWPRLAPYLNPPILAAAWAPLAALPFKIAYVASTAVLLGALLVGLRVLRPHVPALHARWSLVVGLSVLFFPMFRTVTGGQNTAITFALLAGGYASLRSGRDVWAGLWLGLLLYKPQYAVLPAVLLLLCRRWRALVAFGSTAAAQYIIGAVISGADWPKQMRELLVEVMPRIFEADGHQLISWLNAAMYALPRHLAIPVGLSLCAVTLGELFRAWCMRPATERLGARRHLTTPEVHGPRFPFAFGAMICVSISCSPHAQWYDAGLLLLPAILGVESTLRRDGALDTRTRLGIALGFLSIPLFYLAPILGWQPLVLLPAAVFFWMRRLDGRDVSRLAA